MVRPTLAGQVLMLQLVVVGLVLAAVAVISVRQSTAEFRNERGGRMLAVAENLANTELVREHVGSPDAGRLLAPSVEQSLSLSGADRVSLATPDGVVIASSDPSSVDARAPLAASLVQRGRTWIGDVRDEFGTSIAGHVPIFDDGSNLIGLALASQEYPSTPQRLRNAAPDLILFLGIGAALGVAGSWLLAQLIKRRTHGLEPAEIATLADHREALLHSIREGIIGLSPEGVVTVLNDSARELLDLPADSVGRRLGDLDVPAVVRTALTAEAGGRDVVAVVAGRTIVLNRQHARSAGQSIGTVTTLRDRSELLSLQSQLSSTRSVTDTLRAQTHEFANQLHTISGLVQLGEYDDVERVIGTLTRRRAEISDAVTRMVADPPVAALLIAKTSSARESNVELSLTEGSRLSRLDSVTSADVTTVVGNLVDNALEATSGARRGRTDGGRVQVTLQDDGTAVRVTVRDEGPGVPPAERQHVFDRGFSTKPPEPGGRGIGLALTQMLCERRGGWVSVEGDDGAVFTAVLPYAAPVDD